MGLNKSIVADSNHLVPPTGTLVKIVLSVFYEPKSIHKKLSEGFMRICILRCFQMGSLVQGTHWLL